MSSNLDQEMWLWKSEPVSPGCGTPPLEINDWLLFDDKSIEFSKNAAEPVMYDDNPSRAQVATKILEQLDEWIKEEPFSDWLEEKTDLPIFEQFPVLENDPSKLIYPTNVKAQQEQHDNTQTLLQEFETVLENVEACQIVPPPCNQIVPPTCSTLTPPQSPPHEVINVDTQLMITLQPVQQPLFADDHSIYNIPAEESLYVNDSTREWSAEDISLSPLSGDVANELAAVDEYVRSHTKDIPSPSSPCTSSGGSCISTEDSVDDPDWSYESERKSLKQSVHDSSKHRYKPYSRPSPEDKKVRKKEQNKNAATRYRQKKKQEIREIQGEERELADHNEKLKNDVKDLQREIGYLKGLMRDLFKAKGLLK